MITITNNGGSDYRLFYAAEKFHPGLNVTGYTVDTNGVKTNEVAYDEIGDGLYSTVVEIDRKEGQASERIGVLVKEEGVPKEFEIVLVVY